MLKANYKQKICTNCDKMYKPTSSTQEWCDVCLTKTCLWCGKHFRMRSKAHEARAKYCSPECRKNQWKKMMVRENAPNYKNGNRIKSIEKVCKFCGKKYLVSPSHADITSFCSRKCMDDDTSINRRGKNAPNWKGGIAIPRNTVMIRRGYKEWRTNVFTRDGYRCRVCGCAKGGTLRAHHIKSYAEFPELRLDIANGITLCVDCHKAVHAHRLDIQSEP